MNVQIMSDLHVGTGSEDVPPLAAGVDLVAVAGDTCEGVVKAVETLRAGYPDVNIVMVTGESRILRTCVARRVGGGPGSGPRARRASAGVRDRLFWSPPGHRGQPFGRTIRFWAGPAAGRDARGLRSDARPQAHPLEP